MFHVNLNKAGNTDYCRNRINTKHRAFHTEWVKNKWHPWSFITLPHVPILPGEKSERIKAGILKKMILIDSIYNSYNFFQNSLKSTKIVFF